MLTGSRLEAGSSSSRRCAGLSLRSAAVADGQSSTILRGAFFAWPVFFAHGRRDLCLTLVFPDTCSLPACQQWQHRGHAETRFFRSRALSSELRLPCSVHLLLTNPAALQPTRPTRQHRRSFSKLLFIHPPHSLPLPRPLPPPPSTCRPLPPPTRTYFVESTVVCNEEVQTITCPVASAKCPSTVSICSNGVTASGGACLSVGAGAAAGAQAAAGAGDGWYGLGVGAEVKATAGSGPGWYSAGASADAEAKATAGSGSCWYSADAGSQATAGSGKGWHGVGDAGAGAKATAGSCAGAVPWLRAGVDAAVAGVGASSGSSSGSSASVGASTNTTADPWIVTAGVAPVKNSLILMGAAVLLVAPFLL